MDVTRALSSLLLLVFIFNAASSFNNDRGGTNSLRRTRRITLNEYLIPPPPPRNQPVRTGRLAPNSPPAEAPGYFSKFMSWFNPFSSLPSMLPSYSENQPPKFPPAHGPPQGPLHGPPHGPPPGPPHGPPPGPPHGPPPGSYGPPPNPIPGPHSGPPPALYNAPPPPINNQGGYLPPSKTKTCNACNKVPWIPMQGDGGHHSDLPVYPPLSPQLPPLGGGYLPPGNQQPANDAHYAASHEVRAPDFSQVSIHQNGRPPLVGPLPNPHLYPGPMPPLYKAEPFDRYPEPVHGGNGGYLEPPALPSGPSQSGPVGQQFGGPGANNQGHDIGIHGNQDSSASGTQGHAISPNQGQINPDLGHNRPFESPPSGVGHEASLGQESPPSFGAANLDGPDFVESFESNPGGGSRHQTPDLNPSGSLKYSSFSNQGGDANHLNRGYSDDLSSSSSNTKDSHVTVHSSSSGSSSSIENPIHFEQSPLVDLSKKGESRTDVQWTSAAPIEADLNLDDAKTTASYSGTDNTFFDGPSDSVGPTESYESYGDASDINALGSSEEEGKKAAGDNERDVSYIPPSAQPGFLWPSLLSGILKSESNLTEGVDSLDTGSRPDSKYPNGTLQRQQGVKRNKQVQVIIPYTSEYTPIPFQQSHVDWSIKNNFERTQPRKVPYSSGDNYVSQETRSEIRVINRLGSHGQSDGSNKFGIRSTTPLSAVTESGRTTVKGNNSIDVRRLQKNIDNWTIQEYSRAMTSSTILPSSHHYLLPSKKIPEEYLTTTEPGDHSSEENDTKESVKTYSLAGFSFNDVDHEGSASSQVEGARVQIIRVDDLKPSSNVRTNATASAKKKDSAWKEFSISISPLNEERVYVVTPQPVSPAIAKGNFEKEKKEREGENSEYGRKSTAADSKSNASKLNEFESIERAYQVLPQAVNNLAVASTGKEGISLWGIMEHEEFAALNPEDNGEPEEDEDDGPVLYSGHSKVSRARR